MPREEHRGEPAGMGSENDRWHDAKQFREFFSYLCSRYFPAPSCRRPRGWLRRFHAEDPVARGAALSYPAGVLRAGRVTRAAPARAHRAAAKQDLIGALGQIWMGFGGHTRAAQSDPAPKS